MERLYFLDISSLPTFIIYILSLSPPPLSLPSPMARTRMAILEHPQKGREMQTPYTPALPPETWFLKTQTLGRQNGDYPFLSL